MKRSLLLGSGLVLALVCLPAMLRQEGRGSMTFNPDGNSVTFQFDPADGSPLAELLELARNVLGSPIHYSMTEVKDVRITGTGTQVVAREDFRRFFEATLNMLDFVALEQGGGLWVRKSGGTSGAAKPGYIKSGAPFVPVEELGDYAGRYCVITTAIPFQHINAQEAMNMLQTYFADPLIESVRAVTNSNSLIITGYGNTLNTVRMLTSKIDVGPSEPMKQGLASVERRIAALEAALLELKQAK